MSDYAAIVSRQTFALHHRGGRERKPSWATNSGRRQVLLRLASRAIDNVGVISYKTGEAS
jgi:hypothetical protein